MKRTLLLSALFFILAVQISWEQIPQTISYQGVLTDASGTAAPDGNYSLTFNLYDVDTGGTTLWTEEQTVPVSKGIFNVILGSVIPLTLPFDKQYWLGIIVEGGSELTPRIQLTSSAYSLNTRSDGGGDGHSLDAADGSPTDAVFVDNDGNVGIGTTEPKAKLDVHGGIALSQDTATYTWFHLYNKYSGWASYIQACNDQSAGVLMWMSGSAWPSGYPYLGIDPRSSWAFLGTQSGVSGKVAGLAIGTYEDSPLVFSTNNTQRMRITPEGNVGIGTTSPSVKLHVYSDSSLKQAFSIFGTTDGTNSMDLYAGVDLRGIYGHAGVYNGAKIIGSGNYPLVINHNQEQPLIFGTSGYERMRIEGSGNVGIGTAGPGSKLSISGGTSVGSSYAGAAAPTDGMIIQGNVGIGTPVPSDILHIERETGVGGNLGLRIANTRYNDSSSTASLEFKGFNNFNAGRIVSIRRGAYHEVPDTGAHSALALYTAYRGTDYERMRIEYDGNVGIGTTNPLAKLHIGGTPGTDGIIFPDGTLQKTAFTGGGGGVGDITSVHGVDGLEGGSDEGDVTLRVADRGITTSKLADGAVAPGKIATGTIVDADISSSAAISPSKISGTAWTSTNDGSGSGLDADMLDGLHASAFLSTSNDYGRSGVASDLYEGSTRLQDKYLNNDQPETITASSSAQTLRVENTGSGHGVYGESYAAMSNVGGVTGRAKADGGSGVYGETWSLGKPDGSSVAVYGWAAGKGPSVGGGAAGVLGRMDSYQAEGSTAALPAGVFGWATATAGITAGVMGQTHSPIGPSPGVFGVNMATSGKPRGVWGEVHSPGGIAVFGRNESSSAGTKGGEFQNAAGTWAQIAYWDGTTHYGIKSNGIKSTVVPTSKGHRVLICPESPEAWFEDFGEGQLVNGRAHIEVDHLFLETVTINSQHPMKVFIQLNDDCNGVFVKRGDTGFDVIELQKGQSNAHFTYRVVAKRKGFEDKRLELSETD